MRYVKDHKRQTRNRIVENASYGLRKKGAEALSVVDFMQLVGLTHGGFYNYFASRAALVAEATGFAMDQTIERWKRLTNGSAVPTCVDAIVADYLSPRHRDDPTHGCALPALAADIGRSEARARRSFERKLDQMVDVLAELNSGGSSQEARQIATGIISTMVGSILLARAVNSKAASDHILGAGREIVGELGARRSDRAASSLVRKNDRDGASVPHRGVR